MASPFVTVDWLKTHFKDENVRVVDGSWYLPGADRDPEAEFLNQHIPGTVRFDIDRIADLSQGLPHMLPDAETFAAAAGALGLSETDTIVIYDGAGLFSAPRVWWSFVVMGARDARILSGGLPAWMAADAPLESGPASPKPAQFAAQRNPAATLTADEVQASIEGESGLQIVDMRPAGRFAGRDAEPRPGLASGHMPGAKNLPSGDLVQDGRLLNNEDLLAKLETAGIDPNKPAVSSCGSGVTAAFYNLVLAQLGMPPARLYDGSWTEWGADTRRPVVKD